MKQEHHDASHLPGRQAPPDLIAQRALLPLLLGLGLTGCTLTPPTRTPQMVDSQMQNYGSKLADQHTAASPTGIGNSGISQHLAYGQQLPAEWWQLFRSDALDKLVREALQNNPSLTAARAALKQAEENYNAASGSLQYPSVSGQLGASRQHQLLSGSTPSSYNVLSAGLNVSYTLDLFGANRQQLLGLMAATDYQRYQLEATYQTLIFNVVTTAIQEASQRAQLQATQDMLAASEQQLRIVEQQAALGAYPAAACCRKPRWWHKPAPSCRRWKRHWTSPVTSWRFMSASCHPNKACRNSPWTACNCQPNYRFPAIRTGTPAAGHPRQRGLAATGRRRRWRGNGQPVSANQPDRQLHPRATVLGPATTGLSLWSLGAGVTQSCLTAEPCAPRNVRRRGIRTSPGPVSGYRTQGLPERGRQPAGSQCRCQHAAGADRSGSPARETLQLTEKRFRWVRSANWPCWMPSAPGSRPASA
jgi:hypothetical protein